jgi:hypothetical protein
MDDTCPKCFRVHVGKPIEPRYVCGSCGHLYPAGVFDHTWHGREECIYCLERRQDAEMDARRDKAQADREADEAEDAHYSMSHGEDESED